MFELKSNRNPTPLVILSRIVPTECGTLHECRRTIIDPKRKQYNPEPMCVQASSSKQTKQSNINSRAQRQTPII